MTTKSKATKFLAQPRCMTDEQICQMYQDCGDSETVAYHARCSGTTVLTIVRRHGIAVNKRGGRPKPLPIGDEEICRRYLAGESGLQIAESIGSHGVSVYNVLKANGIERRSQWKHLRKSNRKSEHE
jgi:hypothetical protein